MIALRQSRRSPADPFATERAAYIAALADLDRLSPPVLAEVLAAEEALFEARRPLAAIAGAKAGLKTLEAERVEGLRSVTRPAVAETLARIVPDKAKRKIERQLTEAEDRLDEDALAAAEARYARAQAAYHTLAAPADRAWAVLLTAVADALVAKQRAAFVAMTAATIQARAVLAAIPARHADLSGPARVATVIAPLERRALQGRAVAGLERWEQLGGLLAADPLAPIDLEHRERGE